jgi:hypothetical protein
MIIGLRCEMEDRRPPVTFSDDASVGTMSTLGSPYRRATVTLSDDASVGSYSTWSTFGSPVLSEEELAARRAARQRRRAAHAVAQQLDFMYQEREAYRRDAPLRRKRALARKGPSDFGLTVPELAPRPVTPVLPVGNTMTGLTTKGRKKNAQLELKAAAAFLERGGKAEAVARAAAKFKNLRKGTLRTVSRGPRTRAPRLTNMRRELPEPAPQPEPSPWSQRLERRLKRDVANLHKAKPSPTHLKAKRGRAHALRLRRRLKAALGDAVLVSGGEDANLRRERAFLDALSPTGIADQQRMAAGDFRDALAKRLDYRIDHGAASDLAAFFGGHDVHLPDVPGGLKRAARLDAEKFCGAIVRGVAHRASNEAVKREEELEAATARHLEWRAANKRKRKERRRRRKFDASATLSDLRAAEAMVTRGDDDMRITRKLGKAIAARLDPSHPRQVRTAQLLAPPEGRRGILHDAPSPFLTSASAPWEYKDFAELPEADQRILAELIST